MDAKIPSQKVDIQVIQIQAKKLAKPPAKPKIDKKLSQKEFKVLMKNLLEDYLYHVFTFLKEEDGTVPWDKTQKFFLSQKMELLITPIQKKSSEKWIVLKMEIRRPLPSKKKKEYKRVAYLIQKLKSGSHFVIHFKQKKGALFVAIGAKFHIPKKKQGK
ncbi:MAG: hypothetical protein D6785_03825 [Planctomycetota bacterium]|nr:MAG: hypothetical protein D6785_03825 [Planctomycetota bacterium]